MWPSYLPNQSHVSGLCSEYPNHRMITFMGPGTVTVTKSLYSKFSWDFGQYTANSEVLYQNPRKHNPSTIRPVYITVFVPWLQIQCINSRVHDDIIFYPSAIKKWCHHMLLINLISETFHLARKRCTGSLTNSRLLDIQPEKVGKLPCIMAVYHIYMSYWAHACMHTSATVNSTEITIMRHSVATSLQGWLL